MRSLMITRKYPPSVGGMENFARDVYESVSKTADLHLIKYGGHNKWLPIIYPYIFIRSFIFLLLNFRKIDIIHIQDGLLAPMGYVLSRIFRKPWIVIIHGLDISFENKFFQAVVPRAVADADKVICICDAAADACVKRGVNREKIQVIFIGITDDHKMNRLTARKNIEKKYKEITSKTRVLITVGRLVKRKGVLSFINNVYPKIVAEVPDAMYLIVGTGEDKEKIEQAILDKKLSKNTIMAGIVDDKTLTSIYRGSDLFAMSNVFVQGHIEGFGRVILEASLAELPVVAPSIEGINNAINNGKNGVLVKPGDHKQMAKEMIKFLKDEKYSRKFAKISREYTLENYNWNKIAKQYISVYEEVLSNTR